MKNTATTRFLEAVDNLIKGGKASSVRDIIQKSGISNSAISEIKQGRAQVTMKNIQKLAIAFPDDVDINYIFQGVAAPAESFKVIESKNQPPMNKDREIEILERYITSLEKTINEHLRTIADLRRDYAIDAQKLTIETLQEVKEDLETKLGVDRSKRKATAPGLTFTKREGSAAVKHGVGEDKSRSQD